jgi:CubicO group peptidase (beta-lactamase class C family)
VSELDLTSLLRQHASHHSVPGAGLGVLRDGGIATAFCGVADVGTGEPVTSDTRFSTGSLTKSMVATVIVRLAQAGRLRLDDPVAEHVPELRGCAWASGATVRDLLANRSGLPLSSELEFGFAGRTADDDAALSRLATDVARGDPAPGLWSYSNVGWCLLGRVIEVVAGSTWEDAMRGHLDDLGLRDTTFATDRASPHRATGHDITAEGAVPVEPLISRAYAPCGTSIISTVGDLLRFAAAHLDDPSLAGMRAIHAEIEIAGWLDAWCLGWARFRWDGAEVWGWDGLINGERSVLRIVPERRGAVVLMTNGSTGRAMYRSLFAALMPSLFRIGVAPLRLDPSRGAAGDLARFEGVYGWPDRRVEVEATEARLLMTGDDGRAEAFPVDERTFLVDAADPDTPTVTFGAFGPDGRPGALYSMLWGLPRLS